MGGKHPAGIEASKTPELARFLFALGIRHVGERTAKTLAQAFGTLEHVRHAPEPILACLPDIARWLPAPSLTFLPKKHNRR